MEDDLEALVLLVHRGQERDEVEVTAPAIFQARRKSEVHILRVVSEPSQPSSYPVVAQAQTSEGNFTIPASGLVAGLSRDMERIELALRKLMLLR